jgi:3-hydroxymyristoyl/3-hydroxydecanoyl-(acyl carrier protein) dehydratase
MNTGGVLIGHFSFPASFVGFQGHFPGRPILPGVCLVQAMLGLYEAYHKIPIRLVELKTAKLIAPVLPGEDIIMECQEKSKQGREIVIRASCKKDNKIIAMLEAMVQIIS